MNVLSLFDGISCGRVALERAGIDVDNYFASEIKKAAIKCSKYNYPDIIHIGDIKDIKYDSGILYTKDLDYFVGEIDMVIGGSPCQDFSLIKLGTWKNDREYGLNGEKSSLFYEYLRLLKEVNPKYFLLENVKMKKESKKELDEYLGVEGICINSNLVSYQNRKRYYWTNIPNVKIPKDRNISFQDYKETDHEICKQYKLNNKSKWTVQAWNNGKGRKKNFDGDITVKYCENITNSDKIYTLTKRQLRTPNSGLIECEDFCRTLTRKEIELAQTLPIGYTDCLSYAQMQDVCGDGWTVDVIAHIFKNIV